MCCAVHFSETDELTHVQVFPHGSLQMAMPVSTTPTSYCGTLLESHTSHRPKITQSCPQSPCLCYCAPGTSSRRTRAWMSLRRSPARPVVSVMERSHTAHELIVLYSYTRVYIAMISYSSMIEFWVKFHIAVVSCSTYIEW